MHPFFGTLIFPRNDKVKENKFSPINAPNNPHTAGDEDAAEEPTLPRAAVLPRARSLTVLQREKVTNIGRASCVRLPKKAAERMEPELLVENGCRLAILEYLMNLGLGWLIGGLLRCTSLVMFLVFLFSELG